MTWNQDDEEEDYSHITPRNCAVCRGPIPLARLDSLPKTIFCMGCAGSHAPVIVPDPEVLCAKASQCSQNGFAPSD